MANFLPNIEDMAKEEEVSCEEMIAMLKNLNQYVRSEVHGAKGRSDAEVETADAIYIFEFKVGGTPEMAIEQIKEVGYAEKYASSEKDVFLVGAVIGEGERTLCEWKSESL